MKPSLPQGFVRALDASPANWIEATLETPGDDILVSSVVPGVFEGVIRVLHPAEEARSDGAPETQRRLPCPVEGDCGKERKGAEGIIFISINYRAARCPYTARSCWRMGGNSSTGWIPGRRLVHQRRGGTAFGRDGAYPNSKMATGPNSWAQEVSALFSCAEGRDSLIGWRSKVGGLRLVHGGRTTSDGL
jgi:hypothetical protein